jgi:hypothetical protein
VIPGQSFESLVSRHISRQKSQNPLGPGRQRVKHLHMVPLPLVSHTDNIALASPAFQSTQADHKPLAAEHVVWLQRLDSRAEIVPRAG